MVNIIHIAQFLLCLQLSALCYPGPACVLHIQLCIFPYSALWLEYTTELSKKMIQVFMVQRIAYLLADLAGVNQAGFRQNLHVMGQSWLSYLEFFKNIGCAAFMGGKHVDNAKSLWISNSF